MRKIKVTYVKSYGRDGSDTTSTDIERKAEVEIDFRHDASFSAPEQAVYVGLILAALKREIG